MVHNDWAPRLQQEIDKPYFQALKEYVHQEYRTKRIYPPARQIFRCFELTEFCNVKVIILGQDPYFRPGQAEGLCFSVPKQVPIPPSLRNMYQELHDDLGIPIPKHGSLVSWAKQGVLLLNTILSVEEGKPLSHQNQGWETFSEHIIKELNADDNPKVFLLWGSPARKKAVWITNPNHLVLQAPHPSPLSAYQGFFGCRHFSKANQFLIEHGRKPIRWNVDEEE